jgi:hypothetical protein
VVPGLRATIRRAENNHLNPLIGRTPLANVNNGTLKTLVVKLSDAGLGPKSIHNIVQVMEAVVASCVNEDGDVLSDSLPVIRIRQSLEETSSPEVEL